MNTLNSKFILLPYLWFTIPPLGFALTYGYIGWLGLVGWIMLTFIGGLIYQKSRGELSPFAKSNSMTDINKKAYAKLCTSVVSNFSLCYIFISLPVLLTAESGEIKSWMYVLWGIAAAFYSYIRYKKDHRNL